MVEKSQKSTFFSHSVVKLNFRKMTSTFVRFIFATIFFNIAIGFILFGYEDVAKSNSKTLNFNKYNGHTLCMWKCGGPGQCVFELNAHETACHYNYTCYCKYG